MKKNITKIVGLLVVSLGASQFARADLSAVDPMASSIQGVSAQTRLLELPAGSKIKFMKQLKFDGPIKNEIVISDGEVRGMVDCGTRVCLDVPNSKPMVVIRQIDMLVSKNALLKQIDVGSMQIAGKVSDGVELSLVLTEPSEPILLQVFYIPAHDGLAKAPTEVSVGDLEAEAGQLFKLE